MPEFDVTVKGFEELQRNIKKLDAGNMLATFRASLNKGGRVIVKAARQNLPARYDTLRKSLTTKARRQRSINVLKINVGPTIGKKAKFDGWYAHFVEYGIRPHNIPQKRTRHLKNKRKIKVLTINGDFAMYAKHNGVKATPFLRPAAEQNLKKIQQEYLKTLMFNIKKRLK